MVIERGERAGHVLHVCGGSLLCEGINSHSSSVIIFIIIIIIIIEPAVSEVRICAKYKGLKLSEI